jgi:hypothetical protein
MCNEIFVGRGKHHQMQMMIGKEETTDNTKGWKKEQHISKEIIVTQGEMAEEI